MGVKDNNIAVSVENVYKNFKLPHQKITSVKSLFTNPFHTRRIETQHVLKDVNFRVKKGDFFGIVGRNGSGKSTLLKILAEIYQPTKGKVHINGKLVPFIELGVGFNPELTGRENIYLNGALLGFSRQEMQAMYKDIVDFAELHDFMDQKLINYSSGMQVRLAFSIAIKAQADVLVLDEVLAVGDEAFQRKCYQYFAEIKRNKQTVIFVSHNMDAIQQFCTRVMLIDKGHKTEIDSPSKIAQIYRDLNNEEGVVVDGDKSNNQRTNQSKYIDLKLKSQISSDKLIFDIKIKPKIVLSDPVVALGIYRDNGEQVYRWASDEKVDGEIILAKQNYFKLELENILPDGFFYLNMSVKSRDRTREYGIFKSLVTFRIKPRNSHVMDEFWKLKERMEITNNDEG